MFLLVNRCSKHPSSLGSKILLCSFVLFRIAARVKCLSTAPGNGPFSLFDRFQPRCPADIGSIKRFNPSLAEHDHPDATWVAVFRSSNNKPSVFVKDEFLNAMRTATSPDISSERSQIVSKNDGIENTSNSILESTETPVAVARLAPSLDYEKCWILDNMCCLLKKEETDEACDGGSEHTEALCVAIDSMLIYHLTENREAPFDGAIRTKATLVSGALLESRGFQEVQSLSKDMASHTCSLDACLESYANRVVSTSAKAVGARDRAMEICSLLGQIDRARDLKTSGMKCEDDEEEDYDPWAGVKQFL
mmetsp:Transcript_14184/g.20958  ORF Transcript_14184/g.20958 Transcript_14184/m.20958 type:complete len:307 (+) Transcript_14184:3-923(+)